MKIMIAASHPIVLFLAEQLLVLIFLLCVCDSYMYCDEKVICLKRNLYTHILKLFKVME